MTNQKKKRHEKKLSRAIDTIASMIDTIATSMKGDIETLGEWDIKQLKELCAAAKELSGLICAVSQDKDSEKSDGISVSFEGEGEEWAK